MACSFDLPHHPAPMTDTSAQLLRVLIDQAPVAIAMLDREMRYIAASRRWISHYRFGTKNIRGLSHYELFPDMPERWRDIHQRALNGEIIFCDEDRFDRADGEVQWQRWEVRPWYASGAQGGFTIFTEDITQRVRDREQLLALNAEQLRAALAEAEGLRGQLREMEMSMRKLAPAEPTRLSGDR
jgi:PAS domain S-box-containing protein